MDKTYQEDIIKLIKKNNEKEINSLENDINNGYAIICYDKIDFIYKSIDNYKFSMLIPENFKIMDEELAEIKYPGADKPEIIYTNEETTINLTFNLLDDNTSNDDIEPIKNEMVRHMKRLYPASEFYDDETIQTSEGKNVSYFSFNVMLVDNEILNIMFFMEFEKKLIMGGFNCLIYQKNEWSPIIKQMLCSVKENVETNNIDLGED